MARQDDLDKPRGTAPRRTPDAEAFGPVAERFARFFGTPKYLLVQTVIVLVWIVMNAVAWSLRWD